MKKLYLEPMHLRMIKKILKKNIFSRTVVAFGSRVTGKHKLHSDLDLCILGDTPLTFLEIANLREDFSESSLPFRVDIVDWSTLSNEFKAIIKDHQVLVQQAKKQKYG